MRIEFIEAEIDKLGHYKIQFTCSILNSRIVFILRKKMSYNYDVVVIGGGMAGLAAAAKLSQNGVNNVLLVEASDRLGGRMRTTNFRKVTLTQIDSL